MVKFQQISTLAGNLVPSYFEGEVLFTMAIVGLGLLLFALLIGNMQNFLQALGSRYVVIPRAYISCNSITIKNELGLSMETSC
jgi:hypothetical protein